MEDEVVLPPMVEGMVRRIRQEQGMPEISRESRNMLLETGELAAVGILNKIASTTIKASFDGFIRHLVNQHRGGNGEAAAVGDPYPSSTKRALSPGFGSAPSASPLKKHCNGKQSSMCGFLLNSCPLDSHRTGPHQIIQQLPLEDDTRETTSLIAGNQLSVSCEPIVKTTSSNISDQVKILNALEFRKLFLVLSYMGKKELESIITPAAAYDIVKMKDYQMKDFESAIWRSYGCKNCPPVDRSQYIDWDSGKTYLYYCYVNADCSIQFKGPYLDSTRTHLQRSLGDDNILIIKFLADPREFFSDIVSEGILALKRCIGNIGNEGIIVGMRRFLYLGFKDDRQKTKKNQIEKEKKITCLAKAYFVRIGSVAPCMEDEKYILHGKTIHDARRLFMHIDNVLTLEKFMTRFSLIMSKTIKLPVDLDGVRIVTIDDILFKDKNGHPVKDDDGSTLVHTDGTGFISEDLAMMCPEDFSAAKYIRDARFEEFCKDINMPKRGARARTEPPLLIQCRLFNNGCAVKGTLLVNKMLEPGTIHIRPSMIKVRSDEQSQQESPFNSLEIVAVSLRPGRTALSKHLIALLSYGRVPQKFFLDLLNIALEDTRNVYYDRRAALRVAANHEGLDFGQIAQMMLSCGMPLNEPYLQLCLSYLEKDGKSKLKEAKIPIGDTFYLMGTTDPTGLLKNDEVCVILDNGQISGKVLVYRNPGLHFGDIHVMNAVYKEELAEVVGNSKYGIFFSTQGKSSAAYEMATGDFDGDMYWVSRNSELLRSFIPSEPWAPPKPSTGESKRGDTKSSEVPRSPDKLQGALFRLLLEANRPSFTMAKATQSWMSYMDRMLTLGDYCADEKDKVKQKMVDLINIYYDALDAPKSGKKVKIDSELEAEEFPHYMEKGHQSFRSTSVLGQIYDRVEEFQSDNVPEPHIWKLPCFEDPVFQGSPEYVECFNVWKERYDEYRMCMADACKLGQESKKDAASDIVRKYKKLLYDAEEMEDSKKETQQIYLEAIAIYHVNYDYAKRVNLCNFAWRIAGSALCNIYAWKTAGPKERPIQILPSVLREVLYRR